MKRTRTKETPAVRREGVLAVLPTLFFVRIVSVMLLWALCFPLISIGLEMVSPFYFAAMRALLAGGGLLLAAVALRRPIPTTWGAWALLVGIALSATSVGFSGMFLASQYVAPGFATVLANTQPLIAAMLASVLLGERLRAGDGVGLLLGFAGVATMTVPSIYADGGDAYSLGATYVLLAAIGVAIGNVFMKRAAKDLDPLMAMGWQLTLGGLPLLIAAAAWEPIPATLWTPGFLSVLLAVGLLGTALPFYVWFSVLESSPLTLANSFSFLTPVFGIAIGLAFFDEALNLVQIIGVGLILIGIRRVTRETRMTDERKV